MQRDCFLRWTIRSSQDGVDHLVMEYLESHTLAVGSVRSVEPSDQANQVAAHVASNFTFTTKRSSKSGVLRYTKLKRRRLSLRDFGFVRDLPVTTIGARSGYHQLFERDRSAPHQAVPRGGLYAGSFSKSGPQRIPEAQRGLFVRGFPVSAPTFLSTGAAA